MGQYMHIADDIEQNTGTESLQGLIEDGMTLV